jgi:DnaJ-class molecular chaperone
VGTTRDLYGLLGLPRGAPQEDIRSAHRRLVREYHPDANPGDDSAEERFKEVQHAYEVLSDPRKRREYDEGLLRASPSRGGGDTGGAQGARARAGRGAGTSGGGGGRTSGEDLSDLLSRLKNAFSDAWSREPTSDQQVSGGKTSGVSSGPREKKVKGPSTRRKGKRVKGPRAKRAND